MACSSGDWSAGSVNAYGAPKTSQHYIMRLAADGGALTGTTLHSADFPFTRKFVDGSFDAGLSWACLEEGRSGQYDSALELVIRGLTSTDAGFLAAEKGVGSLQLPHIAQADGASHGRVADGDHRVPG